MTQDEVLDIFRQCGALLEGHFILSSGLRSPIFLQKQRVFMHPDKAEILCRALAAKIRTEGYGGVTQIVSPAIGGIIPGYETARHLGIDVGNCCLLLHRRTWTGAIVATISSLTYVGSRYSLGSRYSPSRTP